MSFLFQKVLHKIPIVYALFNSQDLAEYQIKQYQVTLALVNNLGQHITNKLNVKGPFLLLSSSMDK